MKIKAIADICKKAKALIIFDKPLNDGESFAQWVGTGMATYPISGLPYMKSDGFCAIFDINEKQAEKFHFAHTLAPEGINLGDIDEMERMITDDDKLSVIADGRILKPLHTSDGLVFIETRYLTPLADVMDVMELYERRTPGGRVYVAAKMGWLLCAVIMPYNIIRREFVDKLSALTRQCEVALAIKEAAEATRAADEPRQCEMGVDPETGEVLEGTG